MQTSDMLYPRAHGMHISFGEEEFKAWNLHNIALICIYCRHDGLWVHGKHHNSCKTTKIYGLKWMGCRRKNKVTASHASAERACLIRSVIRLPAIRMCDSSFWCNIIPEIHSIGQVLVEHKRNNNDSCQGQVTMKYSDLTRTYATYNLLNKCMVPIAHPIIDSFLPAVPNRLISPGSLKFTSWNYSMISNGSSSRMSRFSISRN